MLPNLLDGDETARPVRGQLARPLPSRISSIRLSRSLWTHHRLLREKPAAFLLIALPHRSFDLLLHGFELRIVAERDFPQLVIGRPGPVGAALRSSDGPLVELLVGPTAGSIEKLPGSRRRPRAPAHPRWPESYRWLAHLSVNQARYRPSPLSTKNVFGVRLEGVEPFCSPLSVRRRQRQENRPVPKKRQRAVGRHGRVRYRDKLVSRAWGETERGPRGCRIPDSASRLRCLRVDGRGRGLPCGVGTFVTEDRCRIDRVGGFLGAAGIRIPENRAVDPAIRTTISRMAAASPPQVHKQKPGGRRNTGGPRVVGRFVKPEPSGSRAASPVLTLGKTPVPIGR